VTPYLGVAIVLLHYREYASVLDIENTSETFPGFAGFGGVDVRVAPAITLGVEGEYRTVPNAIGQAASSVGKSVGETNLGGLTVRVMFGVRLGR
jgi:opacity protein-like surface antigen